MPEPLLVTDSPASIVATLPGVLHASPRRQTVIVFWNDDEPELAETVAGLAHTGVTPDDELTACRRVVTDGGTNAVLMAYVHPADELAAAAQVRFLSHVLARYGVDVRDAVKVTADRWWSYGCTDPSCCPPEGNPITEGATRP